MTVSGLRLPSTHTRPSPCMLPLHMPAGYGFTSKYEDAILHGCIPVVVMDIAEPALSTIVDQADVSGTWASRCWAGTKLGAIGGMHEILGPRPPCIHARNHSSVITSPRRSCCPSAALCPSMLPVRVKTADMACLPEILKAISQKEIRRLQDNIAQHWKR